MLTGWKKIGVSDINSVEIRVQTCEKRTVKRRYGKKTLATH